MSLSNGAQKRSLGCPKKPAHRPVAVSCRRGGRAAGENGLEKSPAAAGFAGNRMSLEQMNASRKSCRRQANGALWRRLGLAFLLSHHALTFCQAAPSTVAAWGNNSDSQCQV